MQKTTGPQKRVGIIVSGGAAPGINGVIGAATIEAINRGYEVVGLMDGYQWLSQKDISHIVDLKIEDVSRIHFNGGSILRTSRTHLAQHPEMLQNTISALKSLNIGYLVSIGGDGSAFTANLIHEHSKGEIKVVHVPKTIDDDLPLPSGVHTFGFQTARHYGVFLVKNIMEDAVTSNRWYFTVAMGRKAGHLALSITIASGATLAVFAEEFDGKKVSLDHVAKVLEGAIIKRRAMGREDGVAILSEGLSEAIDENDFKGNKDLARDEFGNLQFSKIPLGAVLQERVTQNLKKRGLSVKITSKDIGYELRCAPPIPYDISYTRGLGYGAVKFLFSGGSGAMIYIHGGRLYPVPFKEIIDPQSQMVKVRMVNIHTERYEFSQKYMIKLDRDDLANLNKLEALTKAANMSVAEFKSYFGALF